MDDATIRRLAELNRRFYEENLEGFSATRGSAWSGWLELARLLDESVVASADPETFADTGMPLAATGERVLRVLDVACGNLRFERFLADGLPETRIEALAIDSCDELALAQLATMPEGIAARYEHVDVIGSLMGERGLGASAAGESFDLVACFGFMHHVPGGDLRLRLMRAMAQALAPGGFLAVSLWRFMDDAQLAERARQTTARARDELPELAGMHLEPGDCILGWNDVPGAYRYCHHFDDGEVDQLVASLVEARESTVELVARYRADGRTGALNEYLVFQRMR